jgi:hypothetical protein
LRRKRRDIMLMNNKDVDIELRMENKRDIVDINNIKYRLRKENKICRGKV